MNTKTKSAVDETLSLSFLGLFLLGSLALFVEQIARYTTLLG